MPLCAEHQKQYQDAYWKHYGPIIDGVARRQMVRLGVAKDRVEAVLEELGDAGHIDSWQAHWVQMVECELLNSGNWVTKKEPPPSSPYPGYEKMPSDPLPEHATRAGQAAIAKRAAEQELLESRLKVETAEFAKGQRQVLELELKVKREAEIRRAQLALASKAPKK